LNGVSILSINAGSTSLKFALFDDDGAERLLAGDIDWAGGDRHRAQLVLRPHNAEPARASVTLADDSAAATCAVRAALEFASAGARRPPHAEGAARISAVGHRVVHGGAEFRESVLINEEVKAAIGRLCQLAPLHNPAALKAIEAAETALPGLPQVAVFDTAFYAQLPPRAYVYPLPYEWHRDWGIRRFGFHGLSHGYCAGRAAELLGRPSAQLRLISCHLGGGSSATAVRGGVAVATTMGFSPLEGLMMGTRSGSVDPGVLLHLQREHGLTLAQLDHALNNSSGLLGVSGVSADLARIEEAAAGGNERARLAFDLFADRVRSAVGALATTLGGLDALIFTDRIGEGSPALRAEVCAGLGFMGLYMDPHRNASARPDVDIASADSPACILVIHTEEERTVARETHRVVNHRAEFSNRLSVKCPRQCRPRPPRP
jgi:acetate kinase